MFNFSIPGKVALHKSGAYDGAAYRIVNDKGYGLYIKIRFDKQDAEIQDDIVPSDYDQDVVNIRYMKYFITENAQLLGYYETPDIFTLKIQSDGFCRYIKLKKGEKTATCEIQDIREYKIGKVLALDTI